MAIYKSSFNKKPEKKEKEREEPKKVSKPKVKHKVNLPAIFLTLCVVVFVLCLFPNFLRNFFLGTIGLSVYPLCLVGIFFCTLKIMKKEFSVKKRYMAYLICSLVIIWFIFHLILTSRLPRTGYGTFLKESYMARTTAGGILLSLISYPIVKLLTIVGAYIFSAIALAVFVGLIIDYVNSEKQGIKKEKAKFDFKSIEDFETEENKVETKPETEEEQSKKLAKRRLGLEKGDTTIISTSMPNYNLDTTRAESRPINKREYILTPLEPIIPTQNESPFQSNTSTYVKPRRKQKTNFDEDLLTEQDTPTTAEEIKPVEQSAPTEHLHEETNVQTYEPKHETTNETNTAPIDEDDLFENDEIFEDSLEDYNEITSIETQETDDNDDLQDIADDEDESYKEIETEEDLQELAKQHQEYGALEKESEEDFHNEETEVEEQVKDEEIEETVSYEEITPNLNKNPYEDKYSSKKLGSTVETEVVRPSAVDISKFNLPGKAKSLEPEQMKIEEIKPKEEIPPYVAPPVDLLNYMENPVKISDEELQDNIDRLEQVLEDFKVPAKVNNVQVGPAVTRYELTMPRGISVNKIVQMSDDIAMTLASNGAIRVEAPIPGKNSVGIEVPNKQITAVSLRELIDSNDFRVRGNPLSFVLGKDINGDIIFCNLDKMPHLLVAGSTGSGKSVCLNTMLLSMCYKSGPQDLRLILVDPKMVEFTTYNGLPHLLIPEVITGKEMTINALEWSIKEMERRYALFAKNHVVNINEFNKSDAVKTKREEKLPFIVIVVDELADLMLEAKREIEDKIAKLAAKARAAGIHLVLATQRPSVDVITGTVKANLPSRIAFALTNYMDSKTVLDGGGAEKLLGKGDMLFKPQDKPEPRRVQGAFVSNAEIQKVVEYIKENNKPVYDDDAGRAIKSPHQNNSSAQESSGERDMEFDPVLKDALLMFIQAKQASGSMISRRYSVGFNRAGRIMDQMERAGFIGPQEGSKPRQVLITLDEYNQIFGDQN